MDYCYSQLQQVLNHHARLYSLTTKPLLRTPDFSHPRNYQAQQRSQSGPFNSSKNELSLVITLTAIKQGNFVNFSLVSVIGSS